MRYAGTVLMLLVAVLAACRQKKAAEPHVSPALTKLAWLLGEWKAESGAGREHWHAAGGAFYSIGFSEKDDWFEVLVVDDAAGPGKPDGELRLYAMPGGKPPVEFTALAIEDRSTKFANPKHDFPTLVSYKLEDEVLHAVASSAQRADTVLLTRATAPLRAPELEAADRAFSADSAKRGYAAWSAAFEPTGWIVRGSDRVDAAAMRDRIKPLLDNGTMTWEPIASGVVGSLGYTIGITTLETSKPAGRFPSSYARIWAKQADGTWKVRFDTTRAVNE